MSKRDVPKINRDNFPALNFLTKLYLGRLGDHEQYTITIEHVDFFGIPTTQDMKKKKKHNQVMLEIVSNLRYAKFDDAKGCDTIKKMWDALHTIYGGEQNVQRVKFESLKGKFDDMRMEEGENFAQYVARIKEVVSAIKGATSQIDDDTMLRKVLRTLLPIYAIRFSITQELRFIIGNDLTLEGLVGRFTTFELSNYDNYKHESLESTFKAKLFLKILVRRSRRRRRER